MCQADWTSRLAGGLADRSVVDPPHRCPTMGRTPWQLLPRACTALRQDSRRCVRLSRAGGIPGGRASSRAGDEILHGKQWPDGVCAGEQVSDTSSDTSARRAAPCGQPARWCQSRGQSTDCPRTVHGQSALPRHRPRLRMPPAASRRRGHDSAPGCSGGSAPKREPGDPGFAGTTACPWGAIHGFLVEPRLRRASPAPPPQAASGPRGPSPCR
jgi:hypothetical protein